MKENKHSLKISCSWGNITLDGNLTELEQILLELKVMLDK